MRLRWHPPQQVAGVKRQVGLGSAAVGEVQPGSEVEGFFEEPESSRDVDGLSVCRPVALLAQGVKLGQDDTGRDRPGRRR